jgi:hypothetical protein
VACAFRQQNARRRSIFNVKACFLFAANLTGLSLEKCIFSLMFRADTDTVLLRVKLKEFRSSGLGKTMK